MLLLAVHVYAPLLSTFALVKVIVASLSCVYM